MIYQVIGSDNLQDLQRTINELLAQGWQLQGGISFNKLNHGYQAMVKVQRVKKDVK